MKTRTKFIIGVSVLLLLVLVAEYRMPRRFQWVPTFSHTDGQPFGCMVFDSVLAASMPCGYTVERRTLWQLRQDSVLTEPKALLIVTEEDVDNQVKNVLGLVDSGHVVILAITDLYRWCDTLGLGYNYTRSFRLKDIVGKMPEKGLLRWRDDDRCLTHVYSQMIERTLDCPDSVSHQVLASYRFPDAVENLDIETEGDSTPSVWKPIAVSLPRGSGELILVSAPLLLTNYGMLCDDSRLFIGRLMSRVRHLPVIRTESYTSVTAQTEQTPFYVFLKYPPLRWAVYLAMLTVVAFCIFTARRRQRVIPVVQQPQNGNLEFVRLIGTLYWQEHDNGGLLRKKLTYTAEEVRRQLGVDILSEEDAGETVRQLASHTGHEPDELRLLLSNIKLAANRNFVVTDPQLKQYIDQLDHIVQSL